jgi:FkbM family methyltransferase
MSISGLLFWFNIEIRWIFPNNKKYIGLFNQCRNWKRFTSHTIKFNNHDLIIPDGLSFAWQLKGIFGNECYRFNPDSNNPVILDIGSNIGTSIIWFKNSYPSSVIYAFEADRDIYTICKQNVAPYQNVYLDNKACWISDELLSFHSKGADGGTLLGEEMGDEEEKVQGIRLKDFIDNFDGTIDFLKMDIEGAEGEVMKDCQNSLQKVNNIFIEYHSFSKGHQQLGEILSILSKNGFRYYVEEVCKRKSPFINTHKKELMDLQIEIYAVRHP